MVVPPSPPPPLLQFHCHIRSPSLPLLPVPPCPRSSSPISLQKSAASTSSPVRIKFSTKSSAEGELLGEESEGLSGESDRKGKDSRDHAEAEILRQSAVATATGSARVAVSSGDILSLGLREPVYEVVEVKSDGMVSTRKINRRQLLKSSGLRPRDIRSVDPSLWLTNSLPSLMVREHAILLNLGSLRAIAMRECVLIFDYDRKEGKAFIDSLLPRLNSQNENGGSMMPFELEVVEAALLSWIQHIEQRLMDLEPRVQALLDALPIRLSADILEELRFSKQTLVEWGSRAGALKQMLLDFLEDPQEIRRICIMGKNCTLKKGSNDVECSATLEKQIAEEEEEEIEMLLENYLQRCESCHGQAERLLNSAKEMEDSIAVNLSLAGNNMKRTKKTMLLSPEAKSIVDQLRFLLGYLIHMITCSRRLEVSRFELLLQVGTFCVAVGALVAGIFGMNLKSYLEEHVFAFWLTTAGIIFGAVVAFYLMYSFLRARRIL